MPTINAKPDNLNSLNGNYHQASLTEPVFLNSVPKSSTHLMRNIMRMFVTVEQQYHDAFIQIPILRQHLSAFSQSAPKLSWGHLLFSDDSAIALRNVRGLARLARESSVAIMADEALHGPESAFNIAQQAGADVFAIKIMQSSGLFAAGKVAAIATPPTFNDSRMTVHSSADSTHASDHLVANP